MGETPQNSDVASEVMARVAIRVREAREAQGLPRRVLSERSGVSPRYLAQLEAGNGNISIALLQRIATALDVNIEALVSNATPIERDAQRVAMLYRQAPVDVQKRVHSALAAENPKVLRANRICLVGLRGAGKSTLGRLAGEALGLPFVELNTEIEHYTGMPLSEVMAFYGQDGYRALEADAVARVVAQYDRMILAVAGGIVAQETAYAQVTERFHTVWLRTTPAEHMERVRAQGDLRPMQGNPTAMAQLKSLLATRSPHYERADAQVNTSNQTVPASLNDLMKVIARHRFLEGGV